MRRFLGLAAAAITMAPGVAAAQACADGECGPRIGRSLFGGRCDADDPNCGHFGLKQFPQSDFRYIRQFCKPTVSPNSCFGYFKPQITPWGQACPNYGGAAHPAPPPAVTATEAPAAPAAVPMPAAPPAPKTDTPRDPAPKPPTAPLPAPKPVPLSRGLELPTIPDPVFTVPPGVAAPRY